MFRNQYDNDITVWSPQGRIHQIEYAMEAVKQGSAAIALRSKTHAVVLGLKRPSAEVSSFHKKLFVIDDHVGIAISGLTSDARVITRYMRTECLHQRYVLNRGLPVRRLVAGLSDKAQVFTQRAGGRPYGVGLLVVGYDETGPHVYEFSPSGNFLEYEAVSIGARSQSAKTYLERQFSSFHDCSLDQLIRHGVQALRATLQQDADDLSVENFSIGYVGKDTNFTLLQTNQLQTYLDEPPTDQMEQ
eukprot:Lithocolla_globosa_v1_NODE_8497_length_813_cov_6.670185.p1 type:complete len:245 gc:universal NODE_8497_length_813_cov_6.670185:742-8(-)